MIRVTGADEIRLVAAAVRAAGSDRKIVNDMVKEIRKAVIPIRTAIRDNTRGLPQRGGFGAWVAGARITGTVKRSASSAGLTIRVGRNSKTGKRSDLKRLDSAGRIRHMSWGHGPWHAQTVKPGFANEAVNDEGLDQLEDAVITAADNAARVILYG